MAHEVKYLISKLEDIQKKLGGPQDQLASKKESDEFNKIKLAITELINFVTKRQNERDQHMDKDGRNLAVIKANIEIKDQLDEADIQLAQMVEALRRQRKNPKKYPANQIEIKEKQYDNCKKMVEQLKIREEGGNPDSEEKILTLTEMKMKLNGNRNHDHTHARRELYEVEVDALQAFKEKDKELDSLIGQIDDALGVLKGKAEVMGENIEKQEILIDKLDKDVEKTSGDLETANQRLRKLLYHYRKPSQFCMDVVCLLILMGLIAVIIKLASQ